MDYEFEQGSCDVTWKVKNFGLSKNAHESPTFNLGYSRETELNLSINNLTDSNLYCYLRPKNCLTNTTICYDVKITTYQESQKESGILNMIKDDLFILIIFPLKNPSYLRKILIKVRLRDISDLGFFLHRLTFRTVEEVETRKVTYGIPHFNELLAEEFLIQVLPVCQNSIRFEMKLWVTYDGDPKWRVKNLHIDIRVPSETKTFYALIDISAEDSMGNVISSVTQIQIFRKNSKRVCSLKIPFTKDVLKSFTSTNHKMNLKCVFRTSELQSRTWVEESSTLSVQEDISKRNKKEKFTLEDFFLCQVCLLFFVFLVFFQNQGW